MCELDGPAQRKEKGMSHEIPAQLWGKVGVEITELQQINSLAVIAAMKQQFAKHGIPVVVHMDGGPQFVSQEFRAFSRSRKFQHTISLAYNSQSNGKAESAVKIAKRILKSSADPWLALLEWHNTSTVGMRSSLCQRLFSS